MTLPPTVANHRIADGDESASPIPQMKYRLRELMLSSPFSGTDVLEEDG